mgnify:CR=1 FL=1
MTDENNINQSRRKFLITGTSVVGAVGAAGVAVPFLGSWKPSAKAKAALKRAPKGFDVSFKKINYAGITAGQKESGPSITIN